MTDTLVDRLTNEISLPVEWQLTKLRDVVLEHKSGIYKKRELFGTGHNIVGVSDLYENISIDGQTFNLIPLTEEELDEFTLKEGDLIYGESSIVKEGIARTLYVSKNGEGTVFAWHTRKFKVESSRVNSKFLNYLLNSWPIRRKIVSVSTQTALTGITTKEFFDVKIWLPPLPEQRKIVEILSTVDEAIEKIDATIRETQQLKKGLMQKLFIEGIGHTRFKETKIGRIPEDWELLPFDDCVDKEGHTGEYRKLQTKDYLDEGRYPIIDQGQEFIAGYTNDENDVYTGSLPVTIFGDHTLFVKFVNMKFAIGADGTVLLYPNKNKLTPKFFYYLISNHKIKSEGYQRHVKYLKQKWFAIPLLPEQRKIADILSEVDAKIETEKSFKSELEQLKKGLMQVLLTGKVRVKV